MKSPRPKIFFQNFSSENIFPTERTGTNRIGDESIKIASAWKSFPACFPRIRRRREPTSSQRASIDRGPQPRFPAFACDVSTEDRKRGTSTIQNGRKRCLHIRENYEKRSGWLVSAGKEKVSTKLSLGQIVEDVIGESSFLDAVNYALDQQVLRV